MAQLASHLAQLQAKQIEQNEAAFAACFPPPAELPDRVREEFMPFAQWAAGQVVRCLPAAPTTCAAFLRGMKDLRASDDRILDAAFAIAEVHSAANLGNPIATQVVRDVLDEVLTIEVPRSWRKALRTSFQLLPPDLRAEISRIASSQEKTLRRAQNEAAEIRNQHKPKEDTNAQEK